MKARPPEVTVVAWLFILVGVVATAYHASELWTQHPPDRDLVWVIPVRLLALVGGVFLLRGRNWARWLLIVWLAFHVGLSALHSASEAVVHGVLLGLVVIALTRPAASAYVRGVNRGS
jgi:hypothetical protein